MSFRKKGTKISKNLLKKKTNKSTIFDEKSEGSNNNEATKLSNDSSSDSGKVKIFWTEEIINEEKKKTNRCWYKFKQMTVGKLKQWIDKDVEDEPEEKLDEVVYSSGESDMGEDSKWRKKPDYKPLTELDVPEDQEEFLLNLWQDCYRKLRGTIKVINTFGDIAIQMNTFGSKKKRAQLELLENRKPLWFVFRHDHWFSRTWTYFMHLLLIYTAFNIPLNVAFP
jgi:hypothetical protein